MKAASVETPTIYAVRVGPVSGSAFTIAAGAVCSQTFNNDPGSYMTWTFATPVPLSASTTYAIDVAMPTAGLAWNLGIPYLETSGNTYAGGQLFYDSGTGTTVINADATKDRVFHLDIGSATAPPEITSFTYATGGSPTCKFLSAGTGYQYRMVYKTDLADTNPSNWTDVAGTETWTDGAAVGVEMTLTDPAPSGSQRFYEVQMRVKP